ncbi:hypothetical protein KSP40_PGU022794 [Platanthera guangdongensis]|uniref:Uncharacterized protein n=1 Tax=Platanthera guangdongensis TaxID=2320717 RepID=A0ABR2N4B0_9ASPA
MVSVESSNCSAEIQEERRWKTPKDYNHFSMFNEKINWEFLWNMMKTWITKPMNTALLFWIISVVISRAILFMVMTEMLNGLLPKKSQRDAWFEVNNQILNALFTLMCLYQHQNRFLHLYRIDVLSLRATYCKNGMLKPNERAHISTETDEESQIQKGSSFM